MTPPPDGLADLIAEVDRLERRRDPAWRHPLGRAEYEDAFNVARRLADRLSLTSDGGGFSSSQDHAPTDCSALEEAGISLRDVALSVWYGQMEKTDHRFSMAINEVTAAVGLSSAKQSESASSRDEPKTPSTPGNSDGGAETTARRFHEAYERLAPSFGYETRTETREFDPTTPNGRLMIAVCAEVFPPTPGNGVDAELRKALTSLDELQASVKVYREIAEPDEPLDEEDLAITRQLDRAYNRAISVLALNHPANPDAELRRTVKGVVDCWGAAGRLDMTAMGVFVDRLREQLREGEGEG